MPNPPISEQALDKARYRLVQHGVSTSRFAKEHGLNASTVYAVLNGQSKCLRGEAHRAAVLLGIKQGAGELTEVQECGKQNHGVQPEALCQCAGHRPHKAGA